MNIITLKVTLLSDTIVGSGEGYGAIIDTDIVYDEYGIPYVPSRRIKGCLRDSANRICFYLGKDKKGKLEYPQVEYVFGNGFRESLFTISNLYIENYKNIKEWFRYLYHNMKNAFSKEAVIDYFTYLRQQTSLIEGIAKEHSLRTIRCLKKGITFTGTIEILSDDEVVYELLYLSAKNLKHMGTKRNRGFGEVICELSPHRDDLYEKLEGRCLKLDTL
ncbi:MAG: RAMP superfamily CRISPR-associated protein [Proteobacteria bacterium]|nr:RAMP superfamily CRISPR-associated protein [Pseudomonadota bacterium]